MKTLKIVLGSALCLLAFGRALAETVTWNVAGTGDWSVKENWTPQQVPTSGDDVVFPDLGADYTVTVNDDYTVTSLTFSPCATVITTTLAGTGSITTTKNGERKVEGRHRLILDGASVLMPKNSLLLYAACEVKNGATLSTGSNILYVHQSDVSLTVTDGHVVCGVLEHSTTAMRTFILLDGGSITATSFTYYSAGERSFEFTIADGVFEVGQLNVTKSFETLRLTGGTIRITGGCDLNGGVLDLTGGTVEFAGNIDWPRTKASYEMICERLGTRPSLSDAYLCAPADGVLSDSSSLTVRGIKSSQTDPLRVDLDAMTFTGGIPFALDTSKSSSRDIHLYGPTLLRTTTDLAYAETDENNVYVILHGAVTVDTSDPSDASVGRKMYLRGLTSTDGSGSLTVRGCGELLARPYASYDALKSVAVEAGATLGLVDRSGSYGWGHFATESFALGPNATLRMTAGGNFVEAANWAIDPTAKIVVTVPAEFTTGAFPILRDADSKDLPADWVDRVELVGGPTGLAVKSEAGQLTGYLRDDELGKWGDFEWTGAGANAYWSTAANWYGNVSPGEKNIMYFGSSSVTNSRFDTFSPSGSTMTRLIFETNAVSSFWVWGKQLTAYSPSPAVESWSKVPQRVDDQLRMTGKAMSVLAQEDAPIVFGDNTGFAFEKNPLIAVLTIGGDIRMKGTGMRFPRIEFTSTAAPLSFTKLTVLPGATFSATNQESDIYGIDAGFRVGGGGTLNIAGANGYFRRDRTSGLQVINGTMNISVPMFGTGVTSGTHGRSQKFGGRGWLNLSAGTRSGAQGTRFLFADELNVALASWSTATADGDGAMAIRVEGTPTLHVTDGWTYGPAAGVTPVSEVADRALVVQGGATLTVEAGGGTVRFADPFVGDVMTAHLPSTLAISNGTLALDGSFETDVGVKTLSGGTLSVEADQAIGGFASVAGSTVAFAAGAALDVAGDVSLAGFAPVLAQPDEANRWRTLMRVAKGRTITLPTPSAGDELKYRVRETTAYDEVQCRKNSGMVLILR